MTCKRFTADDETHRLTAFLKNWRVYCEPVFGHFVSDADGQRDKAFNTLAVDNSNVPGQALHNGLQTEDGITTTRDRRHIDNLDRTLVGTQGHKFGDTIVNGPTLSVLANFTRRLLAKALLDPRDKQHVPAVLQLHKFITTLANDPRQSEGNPSHLVCCEGVCLQRPLSTVIEMCSNIILQHDVNVPSSSNIVGCSLP